MSIVENKISNSEYNEVNSESVSDIGNMSDQSMNNDISGTNTNTSNLSNTIN